MEQGHERGLPGELQALWFACGCFDVGERNLANISRMTLMRAFADEDTAPAATTRMKRVELGLRLSLLNRLRCPIGPDPYTNTVADHITSSLLSVYGRLLPNLDTHDVDPVEAMWLLARQVFVPTIFVAMIECRGLGIGTEFHGKECWYLPATKNGGITKPVQRVLRHWLSASGFSSAYGLGQHLGERGAKAGKEPREAIRRQIERALDGKSIPQLDDLLRYVDRLSPRIRWLDGANAWKSRLTLAYGLQKACERADGFFKTVCDSPSIRLADDFRDLCDSPGFCDDERILMHPQNYFAVRLYTQRLRRQGKLRTILASVPKGIVMSFPAEMLDAELAKERKAAEHKMNPGNRVLDFIKRRARKASFFETGASVEDFLRLDDYIFNLGIEELNRGLAQLARRAGGHRTRRR